MKKTIRQARKLLRDIDELRRPIPADSPAVRMAKAIVAADDIEAAWDAADREWAGMRLVEQDDEAAGD